MFLSINIEDGKITAEDLLLLQAIVKALEPQSLALPEIKEELVAVKTILEEDRPDVGMPTAAEIFGRPLAVAAPPPVSSPTVTVASQPTDALVDSKGVVWDADIHSSAKTFNADGTWRAKRAIKKAEEVVVPQPPTAFITPQAAAVGLDFPALMQKATVLMADQKLTRDELSECAVKAGLTSIIEAAQKVDAIPQIIANIDALVTAK